MGIDIRYANKQDHPLVRSFFETLDGDYFPPLSKREGGLEAELIQPISCGRIILAEVDSTIIGSCAYWRKDDTFIFEIFGISKKYRGSRVAYQLMKNIAQAESHSDVKKIQTKTWSTNKGARHLFETLGFKISDHRRNHLVPGRTTLIYEADAETVLAYLHKGR